MAEIRGRVQQLVSAQRLRQALTLVERAHVVAPEDVWLGRQKSYLLHRFGRHEAAVAAATDALSRGDDMFLTHAVLGLSLRALGRHGPATRSLRRALDLAPGHVEIACSLLESTATGESYAAARELRDELGRSVTDSRFTECWAGLVFAAGEVADLPQGYLAAPLMSVRQWVEQSGEPLDLSAPPVPIPYEDPLVVGRECEARKRIVFEGYAPYVATLRNVTIFSHSETILTSDGVALNDTASDQEFGRHVDLAAEPVARRRIGDRLLLAPGQFQVTDLDQGIMLSGCASQHFGHWVPEFLFRLRWLEQHPRFAELPIIIDEQMPPQHVEYLQKLVTNRLVRLPAKGGFRCGELVVAGQDCFFPVLLNPDHAVPPERQAGSTIEGFRFLRDRVLRDAPRPGLVGRKIYLSRRKRDFRRLANEAEIAEYLASVGFEIVFTEDMSFDAQVQLFQSAETIVAPNGSATLNLIISPPTTRMLVLSQRGIFNWGTVYGVMRQLGYRRLALVCGDEDTGRKHDDYRLPLDTLRAALSAYLT